MKHNNCNDFAIKYGGSEAIADLEILKFRKSPTILRIVVPTMPGDAWLSLASHLFFNFD